MELSVTTIPITFMICEFTLYSHSLIGLCVSIRILYLKYYQERPLLEFTASRSAYLIKYCQLTSWEVGNICERTLGLYLLKHPRFKIYLAINKFREYLSSDNRI